MLAAGTCERAGGGLSPRRRRTAGVCMSAHTAPDVPAGDETQVLSKGQAEMRARTSAPRRKAGTVHQDTVGFFLTMAGQEPLLTHAEEIELAVMTRELLRIQEEKQVRVEPRPRSRAGCCCATPRSVQGLYSEVGGRRNGRAVADLRKTRDEREMSEQGAPPCFRPAPAKLQPYWMAYGFRFLGSTLSAMRRLAVCRRSPTGTIHATESGFVGIVTFATLISSIPTRCVCTSAGLSHCRICGLPPALWRFHSVASSSGEC